MARFTIIIKNNKTGNIELEKDSDCIIGAFLDGDKVNATKCGGLAQINCGALNVTAVVDTVYNAIKRIDSELLKGKLPDLLAIHRTQTAIKKQIKENGEKENDKQ